MSLPRESLTAILSALAGPDGARDFGEDVPLIEHSLQCASLAESSGASPEMVVAALLHDAGWLAGGLGMDGSHELRGAALLRPVFAPAVVEPVRLHVMAKRYLCTVEPSYRAGLSAESTASLADQGGPLRPDEVEAFRSSPWHEDALALRRWDDRSKVPGRRTSGWERFERLALGLAGG